MADRVHPFNVAVMGQAGPHTYYLWRKSRANTASGGMFFHYADTPSIQVQAITLADVFTIAGSCDIMKLDCEGAEYEILDTTPDMLRKARHIVMEWHKTEADKDDLVYHLERAGMIVTRNRKQGKYDLDDGRVYQFGQVFALWGEE